MKLIVGLRRSRTATDINYRKYLSTIGPRWGDRLISRDGKKLTIDLLQAGLITGH